MKNTKNEDTNEGINRKQYKYKIYVYALNIRIMYRYKKVKNEEYLKETLRKGTFMRNKINKDYKIMNMKTSCQ